MASKAGYGVTLNLDLIPQREPNMTPFEIMLSESQERMLLCVKAGHEAEILAVFAEYDLEAVVCGRVTADGQYRLYHHDELVCDIPVTALTDAVPTYTTTPRIPAAWRIPPRILSRWWQTRPPPCRPSWRCRTLRASAHYSRGMMRRSKPTRWCYLATTRRDSRPRHSQGVSGDDRLERPLVGAGSVSRWGHDGV